MHVARRKCALHFVDVRAVLEFTLQYALFEKRTARNNRHKTSITLIIDPHSALEIRHK